MQCSGEQSCTALWEVEAAVHFSSWEMFLVIWEGVHSVSASAKSGVPKICKVRQSCQKPTGEQCEHRRRGAVLGFCCLGCWALPCVGLVGVFFETELVWEPFSSFSLRPFISSLKASPFYREVTANVPINSVRVRLGSGVMPAHHHPRGKRQTTSGFVSCVLRIKHCIDFEGIQSRISILLSACPAHCYTWGRAQRPGKVKIKWDFLCSSPLYNRAFKISNQERYLITLHYPGRLWVCLMRGLIVLNIGG